MKPSDLKQLHQAMISGGYSFLELETGDIKVRLVADEASFSEEQPSQTASGEPQFQPAPVEDTSVKIRSERVGVFGFGKTAILVGAQVKKGDLLGIIKGISMQDPIKSTVSGTVKEVHVRNGQIVEFGKLLFTIAPLE